jgi:hypothetical protein
MARIRSTQKMRIRRSKSRSKRGGWNFPWSEIETFKKKLREISNINDAMIDANTANNYTLSEQDKTEIVEKLGGYFNSLTDEDRSKLNEQLHNAEKEHLYQQVYAVLQKNRLKDIPEANIVAKSSTVGTVGLATEFANPSSQSYIPHQSDMVIPTKKPVGTGGLKFPNSASAGGKSRRHRRARRTIKKSRKGRKMRRSYK